MSHIEYLTTLELLELHERVIVQTGGLFGIRDAGLLDSALMRPQSGYYTTLFEQAAALLQSLALNHPFFDGNKRVAFAATKIFLKLNGSGLAVNPEEGEDFIVNQVIAGKLEIKAMAAWIELHATSH